jgi:hypothetical protein
VHKKKLAFSVCDLEMRTFDLRAFEISVMSKLSVRERKKQLKISILIVGLKQLPERNQRETIADSKYL